MVLDRSLPEPLPTVHEVEDGTAHQPTARNPVGDTAVVRASGNATGRHDAQHRAGAPVELAASPDQLEEAEEIRLGREPTLPEPRKRKDGAQSGPENYKVLRRLGGNAGDSPGPCRWLGTYNN